MQLGIDGGQPRKPQHPPWVKMSCQETIHFFWQVEFFPYPSSSDQHWGCEGQKVAQGAVLLKTSEKKVILASSLHIGACVRAFFKEQTLGSLSHDTKGSPICNSHFRTTEYKGLQR